MTLRTRGKIASLVILGTVALMFFCSVTLALVGTTELPSIHEKGEQYSGSLFPLCLLMEPVGRRIHDAFSIPKEFPALPILECNY
jgi:hypothetical protein